jgi:hypothetical protein
VHEVEITNHTSILHEIATTRQLAPYYADVRQFLEYLRTTSKCSFRLYGVVDDQTDDRYMTDVQKDIEYIHRFTPTYRRAVLSKFYQLEDWHELNPSPITMLSLTTYQAGSYSRSVKGKDITIPESFELLKTSWGVLRMAIRYYLPSIPFCWIMEPHETGYPHLHVVIFTDVTKGTQEALKRLWAEKYEAGSLDHGADFAVSKPEQSIQSIRNYLMKYVAKGFTSTGSKFGEGDAWTAGQLVFYSLVRKHGWRLFGASKDLCKIMAYNRESDEKVDWYATQLLDLNGEVHTTWCRSGNEAHLKDRLVVDE